MLTKTNIDLGLLLLRIPTGRLMLFHGMHKVIHGYDFIKSLLSQHSLPEFLWIGVPIAEVLAPVLLILGVLTRISGLLIVVVMAFSIFLFFGNEAFHLDQYGGLNAQFNIYFIFCGLVLFFTGGGKYSLLKSQNTWL